MKPSKSRETSSNLVRLYSTSTAHICKGQDGCCFIRNEEWAALVTDRSFQNHDFAKQQADQALIYSRGDRKFSHNFLRDRLPVNSVLTDAEVRTITVSQQRSYLCRWSRWLVPTSNQRRAVWSLEKVAAHHLFAGVAFGQLKFRCRWLRQSCFYIIQALEGDLRIRLSAKVEIS